jgi:DNA polymerase III delta prime subunit
MKSNKQLLWIEKYEPKKLDDLIVNIEKLKKIEYWLENFKNIEQPNSIIISGNHGIGKNVSLNILLKKLNYTFKTLSSNNIKNKKIINDILNGCEKKLNVYNVLTNNIDNNNKSALIIDDTETITLSSEKDSLLDLCKRNDKNKIMPIIFISNNQHSKLITEIKKSCIEYEFTSPTHTELLKIFNKIVYTEKMQITEQKVINSIIKYAQSDIRRLIFILQDLYLTFETNLITIEKLQTFFSYSQKKDIEIGLYDATKQILDNYKSINNCMELYESEKVLLPLMIYENYFRSMFSKEIAAKDKTDVLLKQLDISRKICDSISKGDVIETNIYTDQNWMNQNIHGFYTICDCSYTLNSILPTDNHVNYKLEFSADLNKTSLKNINRKNITNLQQLIPNKNLDDILYINKLIYKLVEKNKLKEAYKLCKDYPIDIKHLEIITKIDKTVPKLTITPKNKKLFC